MALGFVAFTACEDDNDSNPTIVQPTAFEIYLQPSIDGNVNLDLEKTTDPIVLSWSQPTPYTDFNAPVVPTYTVQVSPTGSFSTPFDATAEDNTGADFFNINETYTNGKRVEINPQSLNRSLEELAGWTEATMPAVQQVFSLTPAGIIEMLDLRRPQYRTVAAYGHFGREDINVAWERTDKVQAILDAVK